MRSLQVALQEPSLHALGPAHHILARTGQHLIRKHALTLLQPALTAGERLTAVGEIARHGLALLLEAGLAHVRLGRDVVRALDPLEGEAAVDVPHDVAVHEPRAWVVRLEADNGVARRAAGAAGADEHGSVAAHWVVEVEGGDERWVPGGGALAEEGEVVAVQMHGMRGEELVLDHKVVPFVGLAEVDGVGDEGGVGGGGAAGLSEGLESGLRVVDVDGAVVEEPAEDVTVVRSGDLGDEAGREKGGRGLESGKGTAGLLDVRDDGGDGLVCAEGEVGDGLVARGGSGESERGALVCDCSLSVV